MTYKKSGESIFRKYQLDAEKSPLTLGTLARSRYLHDPKLLPIYLSRYKFVSKMVSYADDVLEVGCGDGFAGAIVKQACRSLSFCDVEAGFLSECSSRHPDSKVFEHDFSTGSVPERYDVIYLLDVVEHLTPDSTATFLGNMSKSLKPGGFLLVGTPSHESQLWASAESRAGHINCRTQADWLLLLKQLFQRVLAFSMNDEIVHTGFGPMSHYLLFICLSHNDRVDN